MAPGTKTTRIADALRRQVATMEPGSRLPSEGDLEQKYDASRGTVRNALAVLVNEGLVTARAGLGYFVRSYATLDWFPSVFEHARSRRDTPEAGADAWAADVTAQGRVPRQDVDVSIVAPPSLVAEQLGTPDGEMVVVRRRLRYVDDVPFQIADSYYPRSVAEGTPIMNPGDVTVAGGLMAAAGHRQVRFRDVMTVRMPLQDEVVRLVLPTGTPVAQHVRTGYDQSGRPVRVIVTIVPGDRHRIIYEVSAE